MHSSGHWRHDTSVEKLRRYKVKLIIINQVIIVKEYLLLSNI